MAAQQALVIGLGQFGMSIATSLTDKNVEVLAIDINKELVDVASSYGIEAIQLDATDEIALAKTLPQNRDFAVCAIGDDSKENSIICTALLRQSGIKRVIARSCNVIHSRILTLVGAHLVVNPELEFGKRLSSRLIYSKVVSDMPMGNDLHITEVQIPQSFVNKNLQQLSLPKKYEVTVIAVRDSETDTISLPDPSKLLSSGDNLIVISKSTAITKILEKS